MTLPRPKPVTQLLAAVSDGNAEARERLWSLIYDELRRLAQEQMAAEDPKHTLQTTALVHEAYFRLFGENNIPWSNRGHFFAAAAESMRRIRIDDARKRKRLKRGGGRRPRAMPEEPAIFDQDPAEVLAVHEALDQLEAEDALKAEIVKLRYFAGLTEREVAAALGLSRRALQTHWRLARAWLHRQLSGSDTTLED